MVRTTLGAEVETTVTVSGSESVEYLDATSGGTISANTQETILVRPPAGAIYELLSFKAIAQDFGAASDGEHDITLRSEAERIAALRIQADAANDILYAQSHILRGNLRQDPPDVTAQTLAPRGLRASASNGFEFLYRNQADADQTRDRGIQLWVRKIEVSQ
jgi:hypothetical protein